jgi:hypothetical protein
VATVQPPHSRDAAGATVPFGQPGRMAAVSRHRRAGSGAAATCCAVTEQMTEEDDLEEAVDQAIAAHDLLMNTMEAHLQRMNPTRPTTAKPRHRMS